MFINQAIKKKIKKATASCLVEDVVIICVDLCDKYNNDGYGKKI